MHVHAVTRVHAVTPKLVICVMYFNVNLTDSFDDRRSQCTYIHLNVGFELMYIILLFLCLAVHQKLINYSGSDVLNSEFNLSQTTTAMF